MGSYRSQQVHHQDWYPPPPTSGTANTVTSVAVKGSGDDAKTLVLTLTDTLVEGEKLYLTLAEGVVQDGAGNINAGYETDGTTNPLVDVASPLIAAVLPRSEAVQAETTDFKPDYYRTYYTVFRIRSYLPGEYRIGAKLSSKAAPTAPQLIAATAAITRTLGATDINIYLPYHIEGTLFNTNVTKSGAIAQATALAPETEYTVYITPADGQGEVEAVLSVTTDSTANAGGVFGLPPKDEFVYTVREEDHLFFSIGNSASSPGLDFYVPADTSLTSCTYHAGQCFSFLLMESYHSNRVFFFTADTFPLTVTSAAVADTITLTMRIESNFIFQTPPATQ